MPLLTPANRLCTIVAGSLLAFGGCGSSHDQLESDPGPDPDPRDAGMQEQPSSGRSGGSGGRSGGSGASESGGEVPGCPEDRAAADRAPSGSVDVRIGAYDFVTLEVPADLVGKACAASDPACMNPLVQDVVPESDGMLTFGGLPRDFDGHLTRWCFRIDAPT
jgi:hypothetical protein